MVRPTLDDGGLNRGQVLLRLGEQQPPDPGAWSQIGDPAARLRAGLADLYRFYRAGAGMLANLYRDFATLPEAHLEKSPRAGIGVAEGGVTGERAAAFPGGDERGNGAGRVCDRPGRQR